MTRRSGAVSAKGRRSRREPWREVLDEYIEDPGSTNGKRAPTGSSDDPVELDDTPEQTATPRRGGLDDVADVDDRGRKYVVEQAALPVGDDGDDNPEYAQLKAKATYRAELEADQPVQPGDIVEPVRLKPAVLNNPAAQMLDSGHGFSVDDRRSRPWKTAPRTHCAHCGGPMPPPDVSKYRCEFDPDASETELALIGLGQGPEDRVSAQLWPGRYEQLHGGCQCSGCRLRWLVAKGSERNVGNPPKCCSPEHTRLRDNERNAWKRAVKRAEKRGEEPPPEPEDRGLKFRPARGLRSSGEGGGLRYSAATGHRWELPRA
jgi:hypothetical protein